MVKLTGQSPECSCPDWETRREKCKHIYAAIFVMRREVSDGNTTVTETVAVAITQEQRPTYPQTWRAYNAAQTTEKDKFQALLFDLCQGINKPQEKRAGRPSLPMSDAIFSAAFKVYSTFSGRRFMSDLREAQGRGYISRTPHYNSIFNYLENPDVTPILKHLITESSLPLKAIETSFAVDSTGFMTSRFTRWFDHKYGVVKQKQEWVKTHIMCGNENQRCHGGRDSGPARTRFATVARFGQPYG